MKTALLAPIDNSLYACLVAHLVLQEPGLELTAVVVRSPWSLTRFRSEWRRDGARLLQKITDKFVLVGKRPEGITPMQELAHKVRLPHRSLRAICALHKIPYDVVKDLNDRSAYSLLQTHSPDVIAFTGGGLIRKDLLSLPGLGILNCHSGILPHYRGMDVVEWPILEKRLDQIGLTLHFMESGVDTGPILLQKKVSPQKEESSLDLRLRMEPMMVGLMLEGLRRLRDGNIKPIPQNPREGRQYFVMHPRMRSQVEKILSSGKNQS